MDDKIRRYFDRIVDIDKSYQLYTKLTQEAREAWKNTTDKEERKRRRKEWKILRNRLEVTHAQWFECQQALIVFDMVEAFDKYCDEIEYYDAL